MILKLTEINTDYAIPFNYVKISRCNYELAFGSTTIVYECGNLDDKEKFIASRDSETIHIEPGTVADLFGKVSPEIDSYNILMARAGYEGELV